MSTITPRPPAADSGTPAGAPAGRHDPLYEFLHEPGDMVARRPASSGRMVAGLILVALGLFFLAATFFDIGGGLLFVGLGAAFLVARVTTGRYAFAVPAGILLGFGAFVFLSERQPAWMTSEALGGWFFILLGAGFLATYLIGGRPEARWPLIPAAVLAGFGLLLAASFAFGPLAQLAWIGVYWPLVLVLLGAWLLVRDHVAPEARRPLGYLIGTAIAAYTLVAMAAAIAAAAGPVAAGIGAGPFSPPGANTRFVETQTLAASIGPADTLRVANPNGQTVVRPGSAGEVRVTATKRFWNRDQEPEVRLAPDGGTLTLEATLPPRERTVFGILFDIARVDYVVEAPPPVRVEVDGGSGRIEVAGRSGAVHVQTSSGDAHLSELSGPATVRASSGNVYLERVTGDLRVTSSSGRVEGTDIAGLQEVATSSGDVRLAGLTVAGGNAARIQTSSGDVVVGLTPVSSARVQVGTSSGAIRVTALALADRREERRSVTGVFGSGAGSLAIQTSSGDVTVSASR